MDPNRGNLIYDPTRWSSLSRTVHCSGVSVGTGEARTDERFERNQLPILISALNS